jgi:hypothetical protein
MPMYYFNLNDDDTVVDTDGTDLPDVRAALFMQLAWRVSVRPTAGHPDANMVGLDHVSA